MGKVVAGLMFWLFLLTLVAGAVLYGVGRRGEPIYAGRLALAGLAGGVSVRFDSYAVPHVLAQSESDLFIAQGYLVAAERMWQMDLLRRAAQGRLAEVLGADALPSDRFFRTLGLDEVARRDFTALDENTQNILRAYASGVNAYRDHAADRLPLEYRLAGFEPAPWKPQDSLAVVEFMAALLSFNAREELLFLRAYDRLGPQRASELFPTDEGLPAPDVALQPGDLSLLKCDPFSAYADIGRRFGLLIPGPASNAWVLAGSRTESGQPLLANDPHLAVSMPGIWYELDLEGPGYHVAGLSLPGVPLVIIGHNADLAWGFTTAMADTQDIFLEKPVAGGRAVQRPAGAEEPISTRVVKIRVKDQQRPELLEILRTSHGTIINGILSIQTGMPIELVDPQTNYLYALRSNMDLPDLSLQGIYQLNTARSVNEARRAVFLFVRNSQNVMLADRHGTIAWQVSGALPVRRKGSGAFPVAGWTGEYGWDGYHTTDSNPYATDPPNGVLVTANNRVLRPGEASRIGHSWMAPYRAQRIETLLAERDTWSIDQLADLQHDNQSVEAERLIAGLRKVAEDLRKTDPDAWRIAQEYLLRWDGKSDPESRAAALMLMLRTALFEELYGDELQEDLEDFLAFAFVSYNGLQETLRSGQSSFWDDVTTPQAETPVQIWARAIRRSAEKAGMGSDGSHPASLGELRPLVFPHAFHSVPVLGPLFDVGPFETGGDNFAVNAVKSGLDEPRQVLFAPSYRVIFSPGDWKNTRGTNLLGQSGHRFSPHRSDQLDDWLQGQSHGWSWGAPPEEQTLGRLELVPGV